jgi:hypothetical protein
MRPELAGVGSNVFARACFPQDMSNCGSVSEGYMPPAAVSFPAVGVTPGSVFLSTPIRYRVTSGAILTTATSVAGIATAPKYYFQIPLLW